MYAKWQANTYTITLNNEKTLEINVTYNSELPEVSIPKQKKGYYFTGYYTQINGIEHQYYNEQGKGIKKWDIPNNAILYAKSKLSEYIISYELNKGQNASVNPLKYTVNTETIVLEVPKFRGRKFLGWYTTNDFIGNRVTEIPQGSIGDIKLYAKWELINYSITYNTNGGENASINPISYNIETEIIKLKNPRRSGYIFLGWYKTPDFTDNKIETISCGTSDLILYAKWCAINYKLIIIVLCIFILLISTFIILSKLSIERKIKKLAFKVLNHKYNLEWLDKALENEKNPDAKKEIDKYTKDEIRLYKQHKVDIRRCYNNMEKEADTKEQQEKKSKRDCDYIREGIEDKIPELYLRISEIDEMYDRDKDINMFLKDVNDILDYFKDNRGSIVESDKSKIEGNSQLFETIYKKISKKANFSGSLLETKMKQVKEKFATILK